MADSIIICQNTEEQSQSPMDFENDNFQFYLEPMLDDPVSHCMNDVDKVTKELDALSLDKTEINDRNRSTR